MRSARRVSGRRVEPMITPQAYEESLRERLMPTAEAKDIAICSQIASEIPEFFCEPDNLQQIFLNLPGNAIKRSQ
jgi:signal transduction histidine kinase